MKQAATSFSITVLALISSYLILQNPQPSPIKQFRFKRLLWPRADSAAARA